MRVLLVSLALLLAGCAAPADEPDLPDDGDGDGGIEPGPGVAPQEGLQESMNEDLHLSGVFRTCDAGYCIDGRAENEGTGTYHVSDVCVPPFRDEMERDGEAVQHREPMAYCAAFGTRPFEPGEVLPFNVTWDGTVWNESEGRSEPAPEGAYQWTVFFEAYREAEGGEKVEVSVTFTVVVGET